MKLFFIRHGQTEWNIKGKIQGSCDIELNKTGILQAEELSEKIIKSNYKFSMIYTSKQKRALKTAQILSNALEMDYKQVNGLEEINFGDWEGLSWNEVEEKYPIEYMEWFLNIRYTKPPKGESYQNMLERVLSSIHNIIKENSEDVVIVTHGAVIMCLQCYLTDTPFNEMMKFKVGNTSILELDSELFYVLNS